jgi:O-antigen/teichoic acid export membrane protein
MNLIKKLARGSLWVLIGRIGAQACMVVVTFLLARRLGAAGFGEYAFIAAVLTMGNTLTTFGTDMYLIREIAGNDEFSQLPSALILQLALSGLFIVLIFLFSPYFPNQTSDSILALRIYSLALVPLACFTVFTSILRGKQKMDSYAWLSLSIPFLLVFAVSIFIGKRASVVTLAYVLLAVQTAGTILAGLWCYALFPRFWVGLRFSFAKAISLLGPCLPIALIAILGILYQKMSLAMLSFLGTASLVGLFSAAARVVEAARIGHVAVFTALYPALANANETQATQEAFKRPWLLLLAISAAGSMFIFFLSKPIMNIFFGADYELSIPALEILGFTLIPYTVNSFLSLMLLARKKEKIVVRVLIISLSLLFALNLWFIPRAGQIGASWAILFAEIAQAILLIWMSNSFHQKDVTPSKGVLYELSDLS